MVKHDQPIVVPPATETVERPEPPVAYSVWRSAEMAIFLAVCSNGILSEMDPVADSSGVGQTISDKDSQVCAKLRHAPAAGEALLSVLGVRSSHASPVSILATD